jgi:hypothetical protein
MRHVIAEDGTSNEPFTGIHAEKYHRSDVLRFKQTYKDGKLNGPNEGYYENGQLSGTSTYKNGKRVGVHEQYWENGQLAGKGTYIDGKLEGTWEAYDKKGRVKYARPYKDGKPNGPTEYFDYEENGPLTEKGKDKGSNEDGISEVEHDSVLVLGGVHNTGYRPIQQGHAMRLKDAIKMSGGLTSEAQESGIRILRPKPNESGKKKEDYTILLPGSLPDGEQNPELLPKDIVWVPPKAAPPKRLTEEEISSLKRESLHEIEMQKDRIAELKSANP